MRYYSDITKKPYDTVEQLQEAEARVGKNKELAEKALIDSLKAWLEKMKEYDKEITILSENVAEEFYKFKKEYGYVPKGFADEMAKLYRDSDIHDEGGVNEEDLPDEAYKEIVNAMFTMLDSALK